jgi:Putative DNA-binding domain
MVRVPGCRARRRLERKAAPVRFQSTFAGALLDPEQPIPAGLDAPAAADPRRRFAVHRNNVVAGLVQTLAGRFPAVVKIVGAEFFNVMARAFVIAHPPRSPLLAHYGDAFADFIDAFTPAGEVAYLGDVARIEAARTRAYHAADAIPVGADAFAALAAEALGDMRVELHSSVEIIRSPHPIVTIWAMNAGECPLAPIEDWRGEDALVARPHLEVEVRVLAPGGSHFLHALAAGRPLSEAASHALAGCPQFNLTDALAGLIGCGLVGRLVCAAPNGRSGDERLAADRL